MADSKISDLTDAGTLDGDELLVVVDDPSGTPVSRSTTVGQVGRRVLDSFDLGSSSTSETLTVATTATDLLVVARLRSTSTTLSADQLLVRVGNGSADSGSNYMLHCVDDSGGPRNYSNNTSGDAWPAGRFAFPNDNSDAGVFSVTEFSIFDYAGSDHKAMRGESSFFGTDRRFGFSWGVWQSTAAIDTIEVSWTDGDFAAGSKLTVYGID